MTKIPSDFEVLRYAASFGAKHPSQLFPREAVREVECPACQADPGRRCIGVSGSRESNHMARCFKRVRLLMLSQSEPSRVRR